MVEFHEKYHQKNSKNGSKIVGGDEVIPHSYPHQVAIFIDGFYFCGGSLIGDIYFLNIFTKTNIIILFYRGRITYKWIAAESEL